MCESCVFSVLIAAFSLDLHPSRELWLLTVLDVDVDTICCRKPWVFLTKGLIHLKLALHDKGCCVLSFVLYAYLPVKEQR